LLLYNASAAQIDNVNAGGVDVPAGSSVTATMTNTEALAYGQLNGAAILQSDASAAEKAAIAVLIAQGTSLETAIQAYQDAVATGNTLIERAARADLDTLGF
jgi:hypothetical protein